MSSENRSSLIIATVVFVVGVVGVVGAMMYLGTGQPAPAVNLDEVMNVADASAAAPPQGAPIDATPAADTATPQGAPIDSAVTPPPSDGAPIGPDGKPSLISKESLELLGKVDPGSGDLFKFDKTKDGLFYKVSFKALGGFTYEVPDPEVVRAQPDPTKTPKDQVPPELKKMQDSPVLLAGFMVPIDLDAEGNVRSFALTQDQMFCCYGVPPKMNQWVMVQMAEGQSTEFKNNVPVAVYGTLDIGEEVEDGYVLSLYRMTSDKVIDVRELVEQTRG